MNYLEYLRSEHWQNKRIEYFSSDMPQYCLGCGNKRFQLHHRTYVRLYNESLTDLVPLCWPCHSKVHQFHKDNPTKLFHVQVAIRKIFGLGKGKVKRRFRAYETIGVKKRRLKRQAKKMLCRT